MDAPASSRGLKSRASPGRDCTSPGRNTLSCSSGVKPSGQSDGAISVFLPPNKERVTSTSCGAARTGEDISAKSRGAKSTSGVDPRGHFRAQELRRYAEVEL